jgi:hypothetical protein
MAYGLDISAGVLTRVGDGRDERPKSVPLVVAPVPEGGLESAGRSLASASTVDVDGVTYAVGSDATAIATATDDEPRELLANGTPVDEPYTRPALKTLLDVVVSERVDGRGCYTTVGTLVGHETTDGHDPIVGSVLAERPGDWAPIDRGFAVVYDQLAADNYTGLGICLDRQTTSVALVYYGVPALALSIPYGGEWVVERAAAEAGTTPERVAAVLEGFALEPDAPTGEVESALARAYDALVGKVADAIRAQADASDVEPGLAIPLAIGGERAANGVEHLFGGRFDASNLPFFVRGVRLADEPAESAARGALAVARDGVTGDGGIAVADSSAAEADDGVTLLFDESLEDGHETAPADAAVDELFERIADRDGEIRSITADLESVASDLAALEAESDTHASDEAVAALETSLDNLSTDLEGLDEVGAIETDLEEIADRGGTLETELEVLQTDLRGLDDRLDRLEPGQMGSRPASRRRRAGPSASRTGSKRSRSGRSRGSTPSNPRLRIESARSTNGRTSGRTNLRNEYSAWTRSPRRSTTWRPQSSPRPVEEPIDRPRSMRSGRTSSRYGLTRPKPPPLPSSPRSLLAVARVSSLELSSRSPVRPRSASQRSSSAYCCSRERCYWGGSLGRAHSSRIPSSFTFGAPTTSTVLLSTALSRLQDSGGTTRNSCLVSSITSRSSSRSIVTSTVPSRTTYSSSCSFWRW